MSEYTQYNMENLTISRAQKIPAKLGTFIIGQSLLGASTPVSGLAPLEFSYFSFTGSYTLNESRVPIIDTIAGTLSMSYWGDPSNSSDFLRPSDLLTVRYQDSENDVDWVWECVVETVTPTTYFSHDAIKRGKPGGIRTDLSVMLIDKNIASMRAQLCYGPLPPENSITRIRRWITVDEWHQGVS